MAVKRTLVRAACLVLLANCLACVALFRTQRLEVSAPPKTSQSLRDVLLEVAISSDERFAGNLSDEQNQQWSSQIVVGVRDSALFRRIHRSEAGKAVPPSVWRAEFSLDRVRRDPSVFDTLYLVSLFVIPTYTQTDMTLTLLLTPAGAETLPAVVVRSGFREYFSWLMIPVGLFTASSDDAELEIVYELTRAALEEAGRNEAVAASR